MQVKPNQYDWSEFTSKLKDPRRKRIYNSLADWCRAYGFAYKTVWALIHGTYVDGAGPKIRAIIDQALKDGLIYDAKQAA